ncbi:MAG: holo-ACP synthase [Clostridiales bacterium]|nr:holo-ACP synthase [Clostridiales bacterium]
MIIGIGNDIIEVDRVRKACEKQAFLTRYFTKKEIDFMGGNHQTIASNFAAKESVAKSFGTGFRGFEPNEIEVLRDDFGKPYVVLYEDAKETAKKLGICKIHISISNINDYATAFVVAEGRD